MYSFNSSSCNLSPAFTIYSFLSSFGTFCPIEVSTASFCIFFFIETPPPPLLLHHSPYPLLPPVLHSLYLCTESAFQSSMPQACRETMELIILPQILDLSPIPLLCCSIPPLFLPLSLCVFCLSMYMKSVNSAVSSQSHHKLLRMPTYLIVTSKWLLLLIH